MSNSPHFQYRIVKILVDNKYPAYKIAEVFFDQNKPVHFTLLNTFSSFPNPNLGISDQQAIEDLKKIVEESMKAFDLHIIDAETMSEI